jgi:hypothetical protein
MLCGARNLLSHGKLYLMITEYRQTIASGGSPDFGEIAENKHTGNESAIVRGLEFEK